MNALDFWRKWGSELNEKDFANAFLALGILNSYGLNQKAKSIAINPSSAQEQLREIASISLNSILSARSGARAKTTSIGWKFPEPGSELSLWANSYKLQNLNPRHLAETWGKLAERFPSQSGPEPQIRLKVSSIPENEPVKPWFRILLECDPGTKSVRIELKTKYPNIFMQWPLRLGFLPENSAKLIVSEAHTRWPSKENSSQFAIGRDHDNCDILVFDGSLNELMYSLDNLPFRMKCNLLLVRNSGEDRDSGFIDRLHEVAGYCRANGLVFIEKGYNDHEFANTLNSVVHGMCHDLPLDFVITKSFTSPSIEDVNPLIFMGDKLANFRINSVINKLIDQLEAMPDSAWIDVPEQVFEKMSIPRSNLKKWPKSMSDIKNPVTGKTITRSSIKKWPKSMPDIKDPRTGQTIPRSSIKNRPKSLPDMELGQDIPDQSIWGGGSSITKDKSGDMSIPEVRMNRPSILKSVLSGNKHRIKFDSEDQGATGITQLEAALKKAAIKPPVAESRNKRFVEVKTFIRDNREYKEERRALLLNVPSRILMRIAPPNKAWKRMPVGIDESKLPKQHDSWQLRVVLSEPSHIRKPLIRKILLPKDGPSSQCKFDFTPGIIVPFEGQLTVLHRGRVIQNAVIKIPVVSQVSEMPITKQLQLSEIIPVRANIGDLDRKQFDLAFVTNHNSDHRPHLTAISRHHAWLVNLEECTPITKKINELLSNVAHTVDDYKHGFNSEKGKELLMELALNGCELYSAIVESELMRPGNRADLANKELLQIVSTKSDVIIPFEFIYDREAPDDDATLCEKWKSVPSLGRCPGPCPADSAKTICPLGFWGLSKVIERHDVTPELTTAKSGHFLQSVETTADRTMLSLEGPVLLAASKEVKKNEIDAVRRVFQKAFGSPPLYIANWNDWKDKVTDNNPKIMVLLPHTDGDGASATLEIGNTTIRSIRIKDEYIRPDPTGAYPIIALLGCDTSGTAAEYANYIRRFRLRGASIVIGTIATVFGAHAAEVAKMLIKGLVSIKGKQERLGEALLSLKRQAVQQGLVMALCLVAFGDADWKLK